MKSWLMGILIVLLLIGTVTNGVLYLQESNKLNALLAANPGAAATPALQPSGTPTDNSALQSQITSLRADVSTLKGDVTNLKNNISTGSPPGRTNAMTDIVTLLEPAVVRIDITGAGFQASGSGFIIDNRGYLLTNQHVIDSAQTIILTLKSGEKFDAAVSASDSTEDIALLKISSNRTDFPTATLATAMDIIVGQQVVAAGFPLGLDLPGPASFTRGIVSAIRTINGQKYIQSDVTMNPGSSGGCLVDLTGKVLGITTSAVLPRGIDAEGIGLVIPADTIQAFVQKNLK